MSLRSSIVDSLSEYLKINPDAGLAWFYCDGNINMSMKTEPRYIFGSIIRQLCQRLLDIGRNGIIEFLENFKMHYRNATDSELAKGFIHAIPQLSFKSEVYIVIDGIDECPDRPNLCKTILQIASDKVRVLAISRNERDISIAFQYQMHIPFTEEQSRQDIAIHIDSWLKEDRNLKNKEILKKEIRDKLLSKSDGG